MTRTSADGPSRAAPASPDSARIANATALADRGMADLRTAALGVGAAGIAACDPAAAAEAVVAPDASALRLGDAVYRLDDVDRVVVLGSGKASARIAEGLERALGDRLAGGAVAVPASQSPTLGRVEVLVADHPLPTARSVAAARRLTEWADEVGEKDLVVGCFTGGSSALTALPPEGVSIADKQAMTRVLLGSGLPVTAMNLVRRHVSDFKGGRLAAAIAPARLVNLSVSDVAGDPLDAITDPTVRDRSSPADALAVLRDHGLWGAMPASIRQHLEQGAAAPPPIEEPPTLLLASGRTACDAMTVEARRHGLPAVVLSTGLEGESRELGRFLGALARESAERDTPFRAPCVVVGCGGEATVTLPGDGAFGAGGPNQELALAMALELGEHHRVAALFVDSDGADGGTAYAGALVDGLTASRARALDIDLRAALRDHRTSAAVERLGDGVLTGATGTNVNDLYAIVIHPLDA